MWQIDCDSKRRAARKASNTDYNCWRLFCLEYGARKSRVISVSRCRNAVAGELVVIVYLASPNTQQQAEHASGMPVLLSFACYSDWLARGYQQSFRRILIDSGAYSEFTSGQKIDLSQYAEWAKQWVPHADAIAGLDDISGDWRRSLRNYEEFDAGFPTMHDTDPPEILKDLVDIAKSRGNWLGIGLKPPREGKERFVRWVCDNVPDDLHIHGWALRRYTHIRRLDSVDSTNWWRDAMALRANAMLAHLTYGECLEIVVKRYQRWTRELGPEKTNGQQRTLFG